MYRINYRDRDGLDVWFGTGRSYNAVAAFRYAADLVIAGFDRVTIVPVDPAEPARNYP